MRIDYEWINLRTTMMTKPPHGPISSRICYSWSSQLTAWQLAENKIVFLNGFKMKISIIIGVLHMLFGVCISFWNNQYFRSAQTV